MQERPPDILETLLRSGQREEERPFTVTLDMDAEFEIAAEVRMDSRSHRETVVSPARRLREVAESATQRLAAGGSLAEGETRDWEMLRARARLLRALASVEGDWSVPSTLPATDSVSVGESLLAAAKRADRQWLTEAQAELSAAVLMLGR